MPSDEFAEILAELASGGDGGWSSTRLCEVTRDLVGVSGVGVMLMSTDLVAGSLCTTNDVSNLIEELQFTLGEGPCVDAYGDSGVVLEPDLAHPRRPRWPAFTPPAVEAGVRAVFAFPLLAGSVRLGALDLYRDGPGPLSDEQHDDAMVMADVIATWVLDVQANAAPNVVADELEHSADFHFIVHNAAGVLSVQLGISVTEALIRLRGYAFSNDRTVRDVAEDVMAHRLRLS